MPVASCAAVGIVLAGMVPIVRAQAPAPLTPPLDVMPLAQVHVTGGYGEVRSNHVHAGVDLSTGGHVGAAVRAPLAGRVERVRASGVGYGRSLYLRVGDGRLLVFGHLDAFTRPLADFVDSVQRASGQYEQDLWPAASRFGFASGETLAWSGQSGAGGPHLHFEVRHGDFALDPLLAGIAQPADETPRLEALTLEPLDEASWVRRRATPYSLRFGTAPETVLVEGSTRAVVRSRSGLADAEGAPPWSTSATWAGSTLEARLDSISWAGEMAELDLVVDRGRVSGNDGFILWRPQGVSPRFLVTSGPSWDGTIVVQPGDPARPLVLRACDANGRAVERTVWLRGPRAGESGPATLAHGTGRPGDALRWSFAALPAGRVRVRLTGTPWGLGGVRIGTGADEAGSLAAWDGAGFCAVIAPESLPQDSGIVARGRIVGGPGWSARVGARLWQAGGDSALRMPGIGEVTLPAAAMFERDVIVARAGRRPATAATPVNGLAPLGPMLQLAPEREPLRRAVPIALAMPAGVKPAGVDVYRRSGTAWEPLRARFDEAAGMLRAESSTLGTFAVMRDVAPPRVKALRPPAHAPGGAYSRWELAASVSERGSGVDASVSYFVIDGVRVPSEWDPERNELRWRPLAAPSPGAHQARIRVVDRAGHATEIATRFVLDSAGR